MHDACRVNRLQALGQPGRQGQYRTDRQRAMPGDRIGERKAGHVGSGQPRRGRINVGVHHRRGEQAAYRPRRGHLPGKPDPEIGLPGQFGPDHLYCDVATTRRPAQVDKAHAAAAQPAQQLIAPDRARILRLQFRYHATPCNWLPGFQPSHLREENLTLKDRAAGMTCPAM